MLFWAIASLLFLIFIDKALTGSCVFPQRTPEYARYEDTLYALALFLYFLNTFIVNVGLYYGQFKKFDIKWSLKKLLVVAISFALIYPVVSSIIVFFGTVYIASILSLLFAPLYSIIASMPGLILAAILFSIFTGWVLNKLANANQIFYKRTPPNYLTILFLLLLAGIMLLLLGEILLYTTLNPFVGEQYLPC